MEVEGRAMKDREKLVFMAKLAEQAERYHEMVEYMKKIARMDVDLTPEERNLLSVGYKNMIGARRASWRLLCCLAEKEAVEGNEQNLRRINDYKKRVEDDLSTICDDILSIIAIHLLPSATSSESVVFFYKMKGDYYRYLAEFKTGNGRRDAAEQSLKFYQVAMTHAMTDLLPIHPVRLALALNFSVLYYEVLNSPERACHMAQQAFDEALSESKFLSEDSYKDATPILELLKDNLTLWSTDLPEEAGEHSKDTNTSMEE